MPLLSHLPIHVPYFRYPCMLGWCVSPGLQNLPDDTPEFRRSVGFEQLGHAMLDTEGMGVGIQGISREEDEPSAQLRIASLQFLVETGSVQLRHAQVT